MVMRAYHWVIGFLTQNKRVDKMITSKIIPFILHTFPEVLRKPIMFHCPDVVNMPIPEPVAGTEKSLIGSDGLKWSDCL